jgi:putative transposase
MKHYEQFRRQSHRLVGYDYCREGLYFITICTKRMEHFFGEVRDGEMHLSDEGIIAKQNWLAIPEHSAHVSLHEFIVMPNHVHGIVEIGTVLENKTIASAIEKPAEKNVYMAAISPKAGSMSRLIFLWDPPGIDPSTY